MRVAIGARAILLAGTDFYKYVPNHVTGYLILAIFIGVAISKQA